MNEPASSARNIVAPSDRTTHQDIEATLDPSTIRRTVAPLPEGSPDRIGRYKLLKLLGQGGMGKVYLAEDTQLRRQVALKVPHASSTADPMFLERFYREARTAARLLHPNICPVFDVDEVEGTHYLTMAYIEGKTLADVMTSFAARPPRENLTLIRTIALALEEAHARGVIHRDLKPSNIMVDTRGEPVVMDFGLAREVRSASVDLSQPGMVMGTPSYMAPEQARGDVTAQGPCCDIYSLGIILYQLLVGQLPFKGSTMEVIAQHLEVEPPKPSLLRADLGTCLESVCLKAIAKEPGERYLTMLDFAQSIEQALAGRAVDSEESSETDWIARAVIESLLLFRTWGWESGAERVRLRLQEISTPETERGLSLLSQWLSGEESVYEQVQQVCGSSIGPLEGWARLGQAYLRKYADDDENAARLLESAARRDTRDVIFQAIIVFQRGMLASRRSRYDLALKLLQEALGMLGREHFVTGRVLDALGQVYGSTNNFETARELIEQAIHCKQRFGDEQSVAVSYGILGWLYYEWDDLDQAEAYYLRDLHLVEKYQGKRGQSMVYGYLGRLNLDRGLDEQRRGKSAQANRHFRVADEWLSASVAMHRELNQSNQATRYLIYHAWVNHAQGDPTASETKMKEAEQGLQSSQHAYGLAILHMVKGIIARDQEDYPTAESLLRRALDFFKRTDDHGLAINTQLELARTLSAVNKVRPLTVQAYREALKSAEDCRRERLVQVIEEEFRAVDEEACADHLFQRARGRWAPVETACLSGGVSESATAIFLNLQGFIPFSQGLDPGEVMRTLNQMLADMCCAIEKHGGFVTSYLGGGFMALVRGSQHPVRAVYAALDLVTVVEEFNRPRAILGLRQLPVRIGVATGSMFLGNIGTYHKMDFTAIGPAVNLAARLMRTAEVLKPRLSEDTFNAVRDQFDFTPDSPQLLDMRELGQRNVWDVMGRRKESSRL